MRKIDFIIQQRFSDYRHGTGVQLKLFATQLAEPPIHICWDSVDSLPDTYRPRINLHESYLKLWPCRIGRGFISRLEHNLRGVWHDPVHITRKLKGLRYDHKPNPFAYVTVASEYDAKIACIIVNALNAKYVVNVMDLLRHKEICKVGYPHLAKLLQEASNVFTLTPALLKALSELSLRHDLQLLPTVRKPVNERISRSITSTQVLKIGMVGSLAYRDGLVELAKFCTGLRINNINFELHYIGSEVMRGYLDSSLPVHYHGTLNDCKRDAILSTMHIAYLPGPDGDPETDDLARFSFPSRLLDYFWHGLPVVGPVHKRSATYEMLKDLLGQGVWFSSQSDYLVAVATELACNQDKLEIASSCVYNYAKKQPLLSDIVDKVIESFYM